MTDSDSLRGDPNHDPTRRHHPELRELDNLRALLRPHISEGTASTEALRGLLVELENLRAREGRRRPMDEAIIADNEAAIARLTDTIESERKLARAAAEGYDHCLTLLMEIAKVFGRVDDLDTLPGMVRATHADRGALHANTVELSRRIDEMKQTLATGANRHEGLPASLPASLEAIQESLPPKLDEECHVRVGRPRFLTVDQKMKVWLIEPTALPGYMISGRNDHWQWNCDAHSTCVAGYSSATEAIAGARENSKATQSRVGLERWMKVCEAFGLDPEEDPPVSIPAILAGDQWTNSRRMLADACAKLQAPSLEVVLGELVQALSRAHRAGAFSGGSEKGVRYQEQGHDEARRLLTSTINELTRERDELRKGLADCAATARAARAALSTLGWSGDGDPKAWATAAAAEREKFISTLITGHDEARKFKSELEAALRSVGVTDYQRDIINRIRLVVAQAGVVVVHKPDPLATMPPPEAQDLLNKLRDVLSVPDGQSIMDYARHAAKGMQALAILGWQSGSPIEWATARAAADAELRSAFAEAQLVGTDHAAMVRELWGNLRSLSERAEARRDWAVADLERVNRDFRDALGILGWQGPMSSGPAKVWAATMAPLADLQRRLDLVVGDRDSAIALNRIYREALEALGCKTNADDRSILPWAKVRAQEHDATARELGMLRSMNAELCAAMDAWRKWAIGKGVDITDSLTSDELRTILDMHEQESRRLTNDRIDGLQVMIGERDEQIESLKAELRPVLDLRIRIDAQEHALAELTRELKLAGEYRMNIAAARRGEVTAFGDALRELPWKEWNPRDICSPIGMFRDLIAEIDRRHKLSP